MRQPIDRLSGLAWNEMYPRLRKAALRRYGGSFTETDIEDFLHHAMLELVDYWVTLPSSLSEDPDRNERFAMRFIWWRMDDQQGVVCRRGEREMVFGLGLLDPEDIEVMPGPGRSDDNMRLQPDDETPEWFVLRAAELEELQRHVDQIPASDFKDWLGDFLDGKTCRDVEAETGLSRNAVHNRRQKGLKKMRERFDAVG